MIEYHGQTVTHLTWHEAGVVLWRDDSAFANVAEDDEVIVESQRRKLRSLNLRFGQRVEAEFALS